MNYADTKSWSRAAIGQHVIADFFNASQLLDEHSAARALRAAAKAAKATVLEVKLHKFGAEDGFTGVALLAESHISIHTWPEYSYAAIDIFMCGNADPTASLDVLRDYFQPQQTKIQSLSRGDYSPHRARAATT